MFSSPLLKLLPISCVTVSITSAAMTTSKRLSERKVARFEKNITRRGLVALSKKKLEPAHIVLTLFAVLVVVSFIFQIVRMALKNEATEV